MYFKYIIMPQEARPCTNFQENILKVLNHPWKKHFLFWFYNENTVETSERKFFQIDRYPLDISLAKWDYSGTTKNCNSGYRF